MGKSFNVLTHGEADEVFQLSIDIRTLEMTFQMDRTSLRIHIQNYISCARITLESIHNGKGEKNRKKEMIKKPTFCEQS